MTIEKGRREAVRVINANGPAERALQELARRQGWFEALGIEARYLNVRDGMAALSALLAGEGDICLQVGFGPALAAAQRGEKLKVVAGANLRAVHVVFSGHPEVSRVADLEGRTVGIGARGALTHQLMTAILLKHGADPAKVRFVTVGNSDRVFDAVVAREVDAGLGEVDNVGQQAALGVRALADGSLWNELPQFTNQASYVLESTIREKRELLVRTLAASACLYRFICGPASREALLEARAAAIPGEDPQEAESQWRFYQERKPYALDLVIDDTRIRYLQELNVAMGLQDHAVPFDRIADMSLAREALALLAGRA